MGMPESNDELNPYAPVAPAETLWDVVVVGTGMGGATVGFDLVRAGRNVLFLERGRFLFGGVDRGNGQVRVDDDERPDRRLRRGYWPLPIQGETTFGSMEFFAPLGCGTGGSTTLYAAQLERLSAADFKPRANYPEAADSTLPEAWPLSYEEFVPYYRRAEELFRVRGTPDPLNTDPLAVLREPPLLSPRDQDLCESFRELGLHPYRAHAGYEFFAGCEECTGVPCPRACKNDARRICLTPALEHHNARLLTDCEVFRLEADTQTVQRVSCRLRGADLSIRAKIVVLAAGALMTPILLLNSASPAWPNGLANSSGIVGRNLMFHASDFILVRSRRALSSVGPKKALALNDFYVSDNRKLGTLQSAGITIGKEAILDFMRARAAKLPMWKQELAGPFLRASAVIAARYFRGAAAFASIIEDLPYADNRVLPDPQAKNGMRFEYRYTEHLRERTRLFRKRLAATLAPHHRIMVLTGENNINFGHACGTCRFGQDPADSVLDRNNRAHDVENLYVVDASFFPSSGGTNPSLTIAANALRVGKVIDMHLSRAVGQPKALVS
jgi:choline dehydrogenase-like flavoprotein